MRSQRGHGPVNQGPESVDPSWHEGGILVIRGHDDAKSLEGAEVPGQREGNTRAAARIGGVDDRVLAKFGHEGDARIFDAPNFFRILVREGRHGGFGVDHPIVDSIFRARRTKVRKATAIFDAAEEKSGPVGQKCSARVEDAINAIRPILFGQDWIQGVAGEQDIVLDQGFDQEAS